MFVTLRVSKPSWWKEGLSAAADAEGREARLTVFLGLMLLLTYVKEQ